MKRRLWGKYQFVKLNTGKAIMLKKLSGYNVEARFPTVFSSADYLRNYSHSQKKKKERKSQKAGQHFQFFLS